MKIKHIQKLFKKIKPVKIYIEQLYRIVKKYINLKINYKFKYI